ncbi:hypothetical protein GCM10028819_00070 [Spirosoma humi]
MFPTYFEGKAVPDILGIGDADFPYLLFVGSTINDFYVCEKDQIRYYTDWKKKSQLSFPATNLWNYFTLGKRLYYYQGNGNITTISQDKIKTSSLSGDIRQDAAYSKISQKGQLYWSSNADQAFLTLDKNLYGLEPRSDGTLFAKLLIEGFDFAARGIIRIHFDQVSQKVYLGTLTEGLFILTKHQFQAITIPGDQRQNAFYSQLVYNDHSILTPNGKIIGKDPVTGRTIDEHIPIIRNVNPDYSRVGMRDSKGTLWFTSSSQLFHLNNTDEKVIGHWVFENSNEATHEIEALCQIQSGPIWIGAANLGLFKIDPTDSRAQPEIFIKDESLHITCLEALSHDVLLMGTQTGLYRVSISTKKATLVEGTKDIYIKSIHISNDSSIWLTAVDKGLMLINKQGNVITFPLDKDAYLASPHCIVNDQRGFFWIPTNRGLFQMAIKDLLTYANQQAAAIPHQTQPAQVSDLFYFYHTMDEGFKTNEFNGSCQPCAAQLPNGYISLPSLVGLVWFNPKDINHYTPKDPIILDRAEFNRSTLKRPGDTLRLPPSPTNIRLFFATAYAGKNYNLNLSYALVKSIADVKPSDWIPLDNEDFSIQYSSLNSGDYTLLVRKLDGFGVSQYTIKKVYILVEPLWYETIWATTLFVILLLVAIYVYSNHRIRKVKRENARLEELVASRTEKLSSTLKELEESENKMAEQVHIMSRLLASITHDVQSPLRHIAFTSANIPALLQKGKLTDVSNLGTLISDISGQMSTMLKDLLDYIKIQLYGKRMNFEAINLKMLIDNKLTLFRPVVEQNGSEFINEVSPHVQVFSDYQLLSIVVHNLLDNAAKYTHQGAIRIYNRYCDDGQVELVLSNPGVDIAQEVIEILTSTDKQENGDPILKNNRSMGLGLLIAKEVADLLMIRLIVDQTDQISIHLLFKQQVP